MKCYQELCEFWGGDGLVCHCSLFDLEPIVYDSTYPDDYILGGFNVHPAEY